MPIKNNITQYLKAAILLHENKNLIFSYSQEINLNKKMIGQNTELLLITPRILKLLNF